MMSTSKKPGDISTTSFYAASHLGEAVKRNFIPIFKQTRGNSDLRLPMCARFPWWPDIIFTLLTTDTVAVLGHSWF